jgi:hypothetical protein
LVRKGLLKLSKPRNGSKGAEYEIISSSNIS